MARERRGGRESHEGASVAGHLPDEQARRRAEAAGLDLDTLREEEPGTYRMLCSQPVLLCAGELAAEAEPVLTGTLRGQEIYSVPTGGKVRFLAFPGPRPEQLETFDALLFELAEVLRERYSYTYYRVVSDASGTNRELDLPVEPAEWQSGPAMVGPFPDEASAREWGDSHLLGAERLTSDAVPHAGAWFCDVFSADEG